MEFSVLKSESGLWAVECGHGLGKYELPPNAGACWDPWLEVVIMGMVSVLDRDWVGLWWPWTFPYICVLAGSLERKCACTGSIQALSPWDQFNCSLSHTNISQYLAHQYLLKSIKIKWKFRHFTLNLMFITALMLEAQMMLSITLSICVSHLLVYEAIGKVAWFPLIIL